MPKGCIFCGGAALTREHVWPAWFLKEHAKTPVVMERTGSRTVTLPMATLQLVLRRVCASCNNEWMSRLENAAKPLLSPVIRGLPDERIYYHQDERQVFSQPPHIPPTETIVLVGALEQEPHVVSGSAGKSDLLRLSTDEKVGKWSRATITLGALLLQVRSDRYKQETGREMIVWPPPHSSRTEWIWPIQHATVNFPPAPPLSVMEFNEFMGKAPDPRGESQQDKPSGR